MQAWLSVAAQCFYVFRIWKFGRSRYNLNIYAWIFLVVFMVLAVGQLVIMLVACSLAISRGNTVGFIRSQPWPGIVITVNAVNLSLDIVLVVAMLWLLFYESCSPFARTKSMVNRLMAISFNSGLVTMIAALLTIIFIRVSPNTLIFGLFYWLIAPLYCNSVLANLNSRDFVRGNGESNGNSLKISSGSTLTRLEFNIDNMQPTYHSERTGSPEQLETLFRTTRLDSVRS